MASVILNPVGTIELIPSGSAASADWHDGSDATYVNLARFGSPREAFVQLEAHSFAAITDMVLRYRASCSVASGVQWGMVLTEADYDGYFIAQGSGRDTGIPGTSAPTDAQCGMDFGGSDDLVDIAPHLADGVWIQLHPTVSVTTTTFYEVSLEVVYASSAPMRRKHPNPTGQGVGPTRHWPLTRRGVTGIN